MRKVRLKELPRHTELSDTVPGFKTELLGQPSLQQRRADSVMVGRDTVVGRRSHSLGICLVPGDEGAGKVKEDQELQSELLGKSGG